MPPKKYVKKSEVQASKLKSPDISMTQSKVKITSFDSSQEGQDNQVFELGLNEKKILHLWLVQILPGSKYAKYKLKLSDNQIIGSAEECQRKIFQCNNYLSNNSMKSLDLGQKLEKNFERVMKIKFQAKIFDKQIVMNTCEEIKNVYKYPQISNSTQKFKNKQYFYLVSIGKKHDQAFGAWFQQNQDQNFTAQHVQRIRSQSKLLSKTQSMKSLSTISKKQVSKTESSRVDEQKQSSVEDQSEESEQNVNFYTICQGNQPKVKSKEPKVAEKSPQTDQKGEEKKKGYVKKVSESTKIIQKKPVAKQEIRPSLLKLQYSKQFFDLDAFKRWIKNNRDLRMDQFEFTQTGTGIVVDLIAQSQHENKLRAVNIYLKFSRVVLIDKISSDNRKKIQQELCIKKLNFLKCQIIEGFMQPGTHEHKLRTYISEGKIFKTDRKNKKFYAVYIEGLCPLVEKKQQEVRKFIATLPQDDKIETIIFGLDKLEDYLLEDSVQSFVQRVVAEHIKQFKFLTFMEIGFPTSNKISLKVSIQYNYYDDFMRGEKDTVIESINKNCFDVSDIMEESDFMPELQKKFLLVKSAKTPTKYVLIAERDKALQQAKEILNLILGSNNKLDSAVINFKKGRYAVLKNFIEALQKNPALGQIMKNIKFTFQDESKINIYGTYKNTKQISQMIGEYLSKLDDQIVEKVLEVTETEANIIQKNMVKFSQQIENNFKLSFVLSRGISFGAIFSLGKDKKDSPLTIFVSKNKNFDKIQKQTLVCFQSQSDLNFFNHKNLAQIKAYFHSQQKQNVSLKKHFEKEIMFYYTESFKNVGQLITSVSSSYPFLGKIRSYVFIMPKRNKSQFICDLLVGFEKFSKNNVIKIHVFEEPSANIQTQLATVKDIYNKPEITTRYYVFDKKEYFYSVSGDAKINQALSTGQRYVYLTNEDLNLDISTHSCTLTQGKMAHIQSGIQTKLTYVPHNRYTFTLKGVQFEIPKKQIDKFSQAKQGQALEISVGAYELDLVNLKQVNLFSNFTRDLKKIQTSTQKWNSNLIIDFDEKINEVEIAYEPKDQANATKACLKLKSLIQEQRIKESVTLQKPMTKEQFENLKQSSEQMDVSVQWDGAKQLVFSSYEKNGILYLTKNIKLFQGQAKQIKIPSTWIPQNEDIQTFVVDPTTKEFLDIQKVFTFSNIKELIRIQNKLVYGKYENERTFLTTLNDGKDVKQMMLFHGTRQTDPKIIYEDKQECFNINYTGDNNYLGRGTYFAVKPEYSNNYAFISSAKVGGIWGLGGQQIKQMFLCSVLVGDSQTIDSTKYSGSIRDTSFKNPTKKIRYESTTTFTNNSTIYAVYKNRRAYPHYLIKY